MKNFKNTSFSISFFVLFLLTLFFTGCKKETFVPANSLNKRYKLTQFENEVKNAVYVYTGNEIAYSHVFFNNQFLFDSTSYSYLEGKWDRVSQYFVPNQNENLAQFTYNANGQITFFQNRGLVYPKQITLTYQNDKLTYAVIEDQDKNQQIEITLENESVKFVQTTIDNQIIYDTMEVGTVANPVEAFWYVDFSPQTISKRMPISQKRHIKYFDSTGNFVSEEFQEITFTYQKNSANRLVTQKQTNLTSGQENIIRWEYVNF